VRDLAVRPLHTMVAMARCTAGLALSVLLAAVLVAAANAAEDAPTVVPRPPFAAPAATVPAHGRVQLELVSSRYVDPGVIAPSPKSPAWAPRAYRGSDLVLAVSQPGRTLLAYGDHGGPTRYLIAKGPARRTLYALDITRLGSVTSAWPLELRWAREVGGVLYVANAHRTYASTTRNRNGYLTALDPSTGRLLWQSPALVANADSFAVVGDVIVTGYGFTAEPDYLYAVDRSTGRPLARMSLPTGPERISAVGTRLSVRTYDHRVVAQLRPVSR
jgi:hypothetical protein